MIFLEKLWATAKKKTLDPKPFGVDIHALNTPAQSPEMPKKKIDTFLKFSFQMDSIIINLFTAPNEGLATFGIHYLSLKGHKLVDESISTSVVLCDVQLDDTRPNRENKLTRFMNRREQNVGSKSSSFNDSTAMTLEPKSMIDVVCNMKGNDMFIDLRVSSFDLILSLDYLMKISNFFQVSTDETPKPVDTNQQKAIKSTVSASPSTTKCKKFY